jgi:galactokinase
MLGLPPSILRELAGRLRELEAVTNETNRALKAADLATAEGRESTEHLLNRALASMEHLNEVAEDTTRLLDELLKA